MKILFIADNIPAMHSGSAVRNYYILKAFNQHHTIDMVGLTDAKHSINIEFYQDLDNVSCYFLERRNISPLKKSFFLFMRKIPYMQQRKDMNLPNAIVDKISEYDVIHLAEINSYFFIEKYLKKNNAKIILDAHNVEYLQQVSALKNKNFLEKIIFKIFLKKLQNTEIDVCKKISKMLVCSNLDKNYFAIHIPPKNIFVVPNGVNISYFSERQANKTISNKKCVLLFMGLLAYAPNNEGLEYFLKEIYPEIKRNSKEIEFHIIGKNPPKWLEDQSQKDPTIKIFGFVADTRPYIANATICIAPILSGSGTRLKILEYMAMKKAIVSTSKGAEGITIEDEHNILIADHPDDFTQKILLLNNNLNLRKKLGQNAYQLVAKTYDWENIGEKLINYI